MAVAGGVDSGVTKDHWQRAACCVLRACAPPETCRQLGRLIATKRHASARTDGLLEIKETTNLSISSASFIGMREKRVTTSGR